MNRAAAVLLLVLSTIAVAAQSHPSRSGAVKKGVPGKPDAPLPYRELLTRSAQALVVTTPSWGSIDGTLTRYEKQDGKWRRVGDQVAVVVAKNGLAPDGVTDLPHLATLPMKREGDGRSPAGIFTIGQEFGFDPAVANSNMPYLALDDGTECVDDPNSRSYAKIIDSREMSYKDWDSSEKMRTIDQYRIGAVVDYNNLEVPGAGSCIFLHIWTGPGHGTAGCTAMDQVKLAEVLKWLDSSKTPLLIQFPAPIYGQLRQAWGLP